MLIVVSLSQGLCQPIDALGDWFPLGTDTCCALGSWSRMSSVTVHNCCMVHGSLPNESPRSRPLLLQTYSAVDSYPVAGMGANGVTGRTSGVIIGGSATQLLEVDGRQLRGAPDWSAKGPPTIFGSQQKARADPCLFPT